LTSGVAAKDMGNMCGTIRSHAKHQLEMNYQDLPHILCWIIAQ
jgi:hypothetical protein